MSIEYRPWLQVGYGGYDLVEHSFFGPFSFEEDIVEPLAAVPRYVKHGRVTWNVAIHSVVVGRTILALTGRTDSALAGLLHDAHEAIMGDIPTPLAYVLGKAKVEETKMGIQRAIESKLRIPIASELESNLSWVKPADCAALYIEKQLFMAPAPRDWMVPPPPTEWLQETYRQTVKLWEAGYHLDGGYGLFIEDYNKYRSKI